MEKLAALGYIGAGAEPRDDREREPRRSQGLHRTLRPAAPGQQRRARAPLRRGDPHPEGGAGRGPEKRLRDASSSAAPTWAWASSRDAITQFRRYVELVPTSSYAHQWIAICHLRLGERDAALREAEAALALDPRFTDARVLKAGVLAARGEHDAADPRAARGDRHRRREADDPARPREDPGRGGTTATRRGRSSRRSCGSSPTPCPASPGSARSSPARATSRAREAALRRALGHDAAGRAGTLQPRPGARAARALRRGRRGVPAGGRGREGPPGAAGRGAGPSAARALTPLEPAVRDEDEGGGEHARHPSADVRRPVAATGRSSSELEAHAELGLPLAVGDDLRRGAEVGRVVVVDEPVGPGRR